MEYYKSKVSWKFYNTFRAYTGPFRDELTVHFGNFYPESIRSFFSHENKRAHALIIMTLIIFLVSILFFNTIIIYCVVSSLYFILHMHKHFLVRL